MSEELGEWFHDEAFRHPDHPAAKLRMAYPDIDALAQLLRWCSLSAHLTESARADALSFARIFEEMARNA